MQFFDTNVFVYGVDPADPVKQSVAQRVLHSAISQGTMVLSTQVMQEFYDTVVRQRLLSPTDAAELLSHWANQRVVGATSRTVLDAIELRQQLQLSTWDALVVRAALDAGCEQLFTEDLQHGMRVGELEIVNPFLQPTAVHEAAARFAVKRARKVR
ncbi:MAG: PIN domain-containing protein [Burkholderiales bacterium]|nr:PIN domain-containing protein [Burkholderiales bacterium]